jgi:methionyl aminopeptidase
LIIHSQNDLRHLRKVGALAADTLAYVAALIRPGMTTDDIDRLVHEHTLQLGCRPAPLGYKGFPKSVCTSVNEVVCHGIPGPRVLADGDIVNIDVTHVFPPQDGWYGDTSKTIFIGTPSPSARHVVETSRLALEVGLRQIKAGSHLGDIGWAIQSFVESRGCSVVREYAGHGIGRVFHGSPTVSHYGVRGMPPVLKRGATFTVEPMVNLGGREIEHLSDGWTVVTRDRSLSAQFEHTVVVTDTGVEILTLPTSFEGPRTVDYDPQWRP